MVYFLVYVNYAYLMRNHHWTHALSHLSLCQLCLCIHLSVFLSGFDEEGQKYVDSIFLGPGGGGEGVQ